MSSILNDDDVRLIVETLIAVHNKPLAVRFMTERRDLMATMHRALDLLGAGIPLTISIDAPTQLALRRWNDAAARFKHSIDAWKGAPSTPPHEGKRT